MRVLITGGAGFLGSHLTDAFIARGDEVFVLDTGSIAKVRHLLDDPRFHYVHDSVFNLELIDGLVAKVDLIYHLAAVVGVEHYVGDPYETLNVNVNGTQNILKAAYKYNKKVVFSSTSEVYGRNPKVPWKEDDDRVLGATTIDRWCYSTSKAVGEHFCFAYHKLGLPVTVVRYFNIYGPRLDRVDVGRLFTIFMGQLLRGADLTVIGDGKQTRCFTYVTDAVAATVAGRDQSRRRRPGDQYRHRRRDLGAGVRQTDDRALRVRPNPESNSSGRQRFTAKATRTFRAACPTTPGCARCLA